jgi:cobalt/nickel transport system ATP-binding protein
MTLFRLQGLCYSYLQRFPALQGVDLEVQGSSRIALIGSNGSGKSTLLKILDALYFAQAGSVEFDGQPLTEERMSDEPFAFSFRKRVGFLFQDPDVQLFSPTVWDELCFGPLQMQWKREEVQERAEDLLRQFGLSGLRDRPPYRLSLGEKKKVALASVLVLDPEVLLLDEPTAALDPRTQSLLLELLHQWGSRKKTIITSTHDLTVLREICDFVHVLHDGKIVATGLSEEILDNTALLEETNLLHAHTHIHPGMEHRHPHTHDFHGHTHEE